MSNLHVNLDEANKHTPKGFDLVGNNTYPTKDENGLSTYEERMSLPKAINFVDGTLAAPSTADGDVFVLTGSGVVHPDWGSATFDDWVRFTNSTAVKISPLAGYLCFDVTANEWKEYNGADWVTFGGGGVVDTLYSADGTIGAGRVATLTDSLTFSGGNTILNKTGIATSTATQQGSQRSLFRTSLWDGANEDIQDWEVYASASISNNQVTNLNTYLDGVLKQQLNSFGHLAIGGVLGGGSIAHQPLGSTPFGDFPLSLYTNIAGDNGGMYVKNSDSTGLTTIQLAQHSAQNAGGGFSNTGWVRMGGSGLSVDAYGDRLEIGQRDTLGISFTNQTTGDFKWLTGGNNSANRKMLLNNTGLMVGDGNVDPTAKLQVKGTDQLGTSTALLVQDGAGTPNDLFKVANDGSTTVNGDTQINGGFSVKGVDALLLTAGIELKDSSNNPAFMATNYGLIATKVSAPLFHKNAYVHTFKNGYTVNDRGLAVFLDGNDNFALDIMTNGVGVGRSAANGIGLAVKGKGTTPQSYIFGGYDSSNNTQAAITVEGKLGLGAWGSGRLTTSFIASAGFVNIPASTTAEPQIYLEAGVAPTSPNNGAIWYDGTDLKMRIGGVTKTFTLV